jgi:hypothetical protein
MSNIGTANSSVTRRGPRSPGLHDSRGEHGEITGCPRENGPGFGLPIETRQNARSIAGMPACDTHPGDGAPGGIAKAGPRPGVTPVTARHVRPAPRRAPVPIPQYPALGRDPRIPARSSAAGAADGRSNHHLCHVRHPSDPRGTDRDAGVAVEGCQKEHERARHEGGRVSAWKMESGWPGAAPEHAPVSTPAARRGYPGRVCGAPAVSTMRSITGPRRTFLASGGLTVVRARWDVGCGTAGHPALQGRPELPTVRGTT